MLVLQNTETRGDKWFRKYVDVPAGDYVIGFEAIATSGGQDPGIAIDDIQLLAGECQAQGKSFCALQMLAFKQVFRQKMQWFHMF